MISYSFILQPQYQPPQDEIYTDAGVEESATLSGYVLEKKDGTYIFVDETGFEFELGPEMAKEFSEMFEIRKE